MGVFDDSMRKLAGRAADWTPLKPERLAGHYQVYEGYDEDQRSLARRAASVRRALEGAVDREALAMGALGIAIGLAVGVAIGRRAWR